MKEEKEIRLVVDEDWDMIYKTKELPDMKLFRVIYVLAENVPKIKIL